VTRVVRPYAPVDRAAIGEICIVTARRAYPDPDLLPAVYAFPYVDLEPELAFVLDDGGTPVGYVLGTADTAGFAHRFRTEWLPVVAGRFPDPPRPRTEAELLAALLHRPERLVRPELAAWPAHLHIDLLPRAQGRGHGRTLMTRFLQALAAAGVPGVHLEVSGTNTGAIAFYERLGFHHMATTSHGSRLMGRTP
jgi:ribosomal protein S18 acetylase RimI-like enzyme